MFNITYRTRYKIHDVFYIILFFIIDFAVTFWLVDRINLTFLNGVIGALAFGFIAGIYEVFITPILRKKVITLIYYLISIIFYLLIFSISLNYLKLSTEFISLPPIDKILLSINLNQFLHNSRDILVINIFTYIILLHLVREVRLKSVKGVYKFYYWGKVGKPVSENRIIMIMDLKSSTEIAEMLGHEKYSEFIEKIYFEIDEAIIESKGSLYQYVGDEVVISWIEENGIKNENCVMCFRLIEQRISDLEKHFIDNFGIVPYFNAGIHCGEVAINEVGGILKREIAFHGDVINTTSRICDLSKSSKYNLLVSSNLFNHFSVTNKIFSYNYYSNYHFKGKLKSNEIYYVK